MHFLQRNVGFSAINPTLGGDVDQGAYAYRIPQMRRRCTKCDDAMEDETFVRAFFQLYFRITDEHGNSLDVSVSDERVGLLCSIYLIHPG